VPRYKILRLDDRRSGPLKGIVRSDNESWNSLEEALNELGETGWEIAIPVYGPVPGREHQGDNWLEAIILFNKVHSASDDLDRRIAKVKEIIAEAEQDMASNPEDSPKNRAAKSQIQMSSKYLGQLLEEKEKSGKPSGCAGPREGE